MGTRFSRRMWLLSAVAATASASTSLAQRPLVPVKARIQASLSKVPVRSIQIQGLQASVDTRVVVTAIAVDPSGERLAVAGDDHTIRIMNASTLVQTDLLPGHRDLIRTLTFNPSGQVLASAGNDGQLILWDCQNSFTELRRLAAAPALTCVRFSPAGAVLAAVGFDNRVFFIGREQRGDVTCDCKDLRAVAYRDDDSVLAVGGRSGNLHLFDPRDGEPLGVYPVHRGRIHGVYFHRDSNLAITVGEDGYVNVFDSMNRTVKHRIMVTTGKIFTVAQVDSQRVAVAGSDNSIRVVNTDTGKVEHRLEGHQGSIASLASSGGQLFSGGYDASLKKWSIGELSQSQQRIAEADPSIDR